MKVNDMAGQRQFFIESFSLKTIVLYSVGGLLAIAFGWIAGTGSLPAAAVAIGLIGGLIMLTSPSLLLWSVLAGGLIASGLAMLYAPQLQLIRWGVAIASVMLVVLALIENISRRSLGKAGAISPMAWQLLALFFITALSGWANGQGISQLVIGLKSYFQVAGLFFALVMMPWPQRVMDLFPRLMLLTAFIQLPFVAHQYLFLVPARIGFGEGVVPYDVIAGTFGASKFGGGANAVLSAFMLIVVAVLLSLWNNKAISLRRLLVFALPLLVPVFINESKVSILYLLVIVCVIFKNEIVMRPARAILSAGFLALMLAGLMVAYSTFYADESEGVQDFIAGTIEQNFGDEQGHGEFYLNRSSAISFWFQEHSLNEPMHVLIGHGPRASREGGSGLDAGVTLASKRYPGMGIGLTGVPALLWETGVLGFAMVAAMFWGAFRSAGILRQRYRFDPYKGGIFSGLQAGVVILALSMFHKSFFVFDIGYQTVVMLLFAYLTYYLKQEPEPAASKPRLALHRTA
jgi:hypothetical protein